MKREKFFGTTAFIAVVILAFALSGCPTRQTKAKGAGDEVGSAAVDEATDAVADNVRREVHEGVNDAFKGIFKK
jgi:predicted small secreted protein